MKTSKIKLYIEALLLLAFAAAFAGASIAYFTDQQTVKTTFTSGAVTIELTEAVVMLDELGNLVEDTSQDRVTVTAGNTFVHDYGKIYPAQSIYKDPTIKNTGSSPCWIAAKIVLEDGLGDLHNVMGYENYDDLDIEVLFSGGLLDEKVHVGDWNGFSYVCYNDRYAMLQKTNREENYYEFYFFMLEKLPVNEEVTIFEYLNIPDDWTSTEMRELMELTVTVEAYAVQQTGFETCYDAMTKAFPSHFDLD